MENSYQLQTAAFEIIERCNLYCDFCVRSAHSGLKGILTLQNFHKRLNNITDKCQSLELIALSGGEPFLHPDIVNLVRLARIYAPTVCITTNATVCNKFLIEELTQIQGLHLIVSLDGPDAPTHDTIRGQKGAFSKLNKFAGLLMENNLPFLVNMTVSEKNSNLISETVSIAKNLGAKDISIALVKPEGRGYIPPDVSNLLGEIGYQVWLAKSYFESETFKVRFTDPLAFVFNDSSSETPGCGASNRSVHVQYDGKVLICTSCQESLGNLDNPNFNLHESLTFDNRLISIKSGRLKDACGSCEYLSSCGGCRCRAFIFDADFLGADPLCPKNHRYRETRVFKSIASSSSQMKLTNISVESTASTEKTLLISQTTAIEEIASMMKAHCEFNTVSWSNIEEFTFEGIENSKYSRIFLADVPDTAIESGDWFNSIKSMLKTNFHIVIISQQEELSLPSKSAKLIFQLKKGFNLSYEILNFSPQQVEIFASF